MAGLSIVPLALPPATELIPMAMAARGSDQEQSTNRKCDGEFFADFC